MREGRVCVNVAFVHVEARVHAMHSCVEGIKLSIQSSLISIMISWLLAQAALTMDEGTKKFYQGVHETEWLKYSHPSTIFMCVANAESKVAHFLTHLCLR